MKDKIVNIGDDIYVIPSNIMNNYEVDIKIKINNKSITYPNINMDINVYDDDRNNILSVTYKINKFRYDSLHYIINKLTLILGSLIEPK